MTKTDDPAERIPPLTQTALRAELLAYRPQDGQEQADLRLMLSLMDKHGDLLDRENEAAHFTGSAWIVNRARTAVLMVFHNLYQSWAWTGGHADGEADLLSVAIREAQEETGLTTIHPVSNDILSLDVLPVWRHVRRGRHVPSHLHLNAAYLLEADDAAPLQVRPDENSGVRWVPLAEVSSWCTEPDMQPLYAKLNARMLRMY
jgi:8-oxo-dGTP pyrophosphatase MutT (NUDIX family)